MKSLKNALAALVMLAAGLAFAGPSLAQATASPQLATQVAHELFTAMDMADLIRQGAMSNAGALDAFGKIRPEWRQMMTQSMDEAVARNQPNMEAVMGHAFAKTMTNEELSAALIVFRDPQARAVFAAAARHQAAPGDLAHPCAAECMRAMSSSAGRGFMTKMGTAFGPEMQSEMIAAIVPDMFIIFGENAKASEAKRAAP
jgi:hypothetical protein